VDRGERKFRRKKENEIAGKGKETTPNSNREKGVWLGKETGV